MEVVEKLSNGNTIIYKIVNDTAYHKQTNEKVVEILEKARKNRWRLKIHYGSVETGKDWNEVYDTTGYVGRSMGTIKVPLLLYSVRSWGGGSILDHCIVKIEFANKKNGGVLYQHPKYYLGDYDTSCNK